MGNGRKSVQFRAVYMQLLWVTCFFFVSRCHHAGDSFSRRAAAEGPVRGFD